MGFIIVSSLNWVVVDFVWFCFELGLNGVQAGLELAVEQGMALSFCPSCLYHFLNAGITKHEPLTIPGLNFSLPKIPSRPSTV